MKECDSLEAVIFDLGGVIFGIALEPVIHSWAKSTGVSPQEMAARFRIDSHYERFEVAEISAAQYRSHVCDLLGVSLSDEDFDRGWNSIYLEVLPGMESLLKQLQKSVRLVVLTNTNEIHARVWRALYRDVLKYFEKVFASYEIGARKPDPESFRIVLDYLAVDPGKVLFIDDNPENVRGASSLGIRGLVMTDPRGIAEEFRQYGLGKAGKREGARERRSAGAKE